MNGERLPGQWRRITIHRLMDGTHAFAVFLSSSPSTHICLEGSQQREKSGRNRQERETRVTAGRIKLKGNVRWEFRTRSGDRGKERTDRLGSTIRVHEMPVRIPNIPGDDDNLPDGETSITSPYIGFSFLFAICSHTHPAPFELNDSWCDTPLCPHMRVCMCVILTLFAACNRVTVTGYKGLRYMRRIAYVHEIKLIHQVLSLVHNDTQHTSHITSHHEFTLELRTKRLGLGWKGFDEELREWRAGNTWCQSLGWRIVSRKNFTRLRTEQKSVRWDERMCDVERDSRLTRQEYSPLSSLVVWCIMRIGGLVETLNTDLPFQLSGTKCVPRIRGFILWWWCWGWNPPSKRSLSPDDDADGDDTDEEVNEEEDAGEDAAADAGATTWCCCCCCCWCNCIIPTPPPPDLLNEFLTSSV